VGFSLNENESIVVSVQTQEVRGPFNPQSLLLFTDRRLAILNFRKPTEMAAAISSAKELSSWIDSQLPSNKLNVAIPYENIEQLKLHKHAYYLTGHGKVISVKFTKSDGKKDDRIFMLVDPRNFTDLTDKLSSIVPLSGRLKCP
jgi:hypothetical protein